MCALSKKKCPDFGPKSPDQRLCFASYLWSQSSTTFGSKVLLNSVIKYLHLSIYRSSNLVARKLNVIEIFEFQKRSYFVFEKKGKLKRARCCYKCALEPGRGILYSPDNPWQTDTLQMDICSNSSQQKIRYKAFLLKNRGVYGVEWRGDLNLTIAPAPVLCSNTW